MNLDELTYGQIKELKMLFGKPTKPKATLPLEVGQNYFIRTVTLYYTGKLKALYPDALVLSDAAWVADTGRFYNFLKEGKVNEVEPFVDDVIIPLGSVIDVTAWHHKLLRVQK